MAEFTYEGVKRIKKSIIARFGCYEPLQAGIHGLGEPTKHPRLDLPSTLVCKIKAKKLLTNVNCSAIDGSPCPEGFSVETLQKLAK